MSNPRLPRDITLKKRSSELRNNATKEENYLWYKYLRIYSVHFYRQYIIDEYIVDFYCPKAKLVIELDGSQHSMEKVKEYDIARAHCLENLGLKILRFSNTDIMQNFTNICMAINLEVQHHIK
ncbi:MAG: endonuclease domain-containing protein [Eubacteriales bacterium]